ncbi:MAG: diacylglycerol kinase family lipid kinase [Calditrichaeota bacterium]|nr:MAG: diacylglycerol kinase family lipid kinase [Calditrichota bacterium]
MNHRVVEVDIRKVLFIVNPIFRINRNPDRIIEWIRESWSKEEKKYEIVKTAHRGHGTELAKQAVKDGYDMVVAVGGDGTINEIAQGLIDTNTVLGIIPAGSGNGFARNMRIPLNHKKAIKLLQSPSIRQIDVGRINGHYFFNIAGFGLDANISTLFEHSSMRGPIPYFLIAFREFFTYTPQEVEIHFDGRELRREPILLCFANLPEYGVNAVIAPNAKPDDGLIDVCILNPISKAKAVLNIHKLFNGSVDELPELEIYQTEKVMIRRPAPGPIHTDGDPHQEGETLTVEVLPQKLLVALGEEAPW